MCQYIDHIRARHLYLYTCSYLALSTDVYREIAADISGVNQLIGDMTNGASQIKTSAYELNDLAEKPNTMVGRFKI